MERKFFNNENFANYGTLCTFSDIAKEEVAVDCKGKVESDHDQGGKIQDQGHVLWTLHARLKWNHLNEARREKLISITEGACTKFV